MTDVVANRGGDRLELDIEGMTCAACVTRLEKALSRAPGVREVSVNLALERASVVVDTGATGIGALSDAVSGAGFSVGRETLAFAVEGMTCAACVTRVERALGRIPGVLEASVNLVAERASINVVRGQVRSEAVASALERAGYSANFDPSEPSRQAQLDDAKAVNERRIVILSAALTTPLVLGMLFQVLGYEDLHVMPAFEVLIATPIQFVIGFRFYRGAFNALRGGSANMDVLVALGTTAAYGFSWYLLQTLGEEADGQLYFEASAVIITLVLLGKYLENRAKRGTTRAIRALMELRPPIARVDQADGTIVETGITRVVSGNLVVVRPGERIPVDGEVVDGASDVDESLVTGESVPVAKTPGDAVTGGAINGAGLLKVRATTVGEDSTLSRIVRLVENAQAGKAAVQRLVDRISAVFVPAVMGVAAITFVAWIAVSGEVEPSLIAAVSVLVIACPCALGLATPTAIMTGTGAAARAGILIKDVDALEQAHHIDTVIFDKTGTLTEGRPRVARTFAAARDDQYLLTVAASVQQGSEHPLARAVTERANEVGLTLFSLGEFEAVPGSGARGIVNGNRICLGNAEFVAEHAPIDDAFRARARDWEREGTTVVFVAESDNLLGLIGINDPVRDTAPAAIDALRDIGVRATVLSGDSEAVVRRVAETVGIKDSEGGVRPDDKARMVEEMTAGGRIVGMVGDGINDAPALASANVGFALGAGTDIAMETAGVTLMRSDPRMVAGAISASRATFRKIKQNLFWAFAYNVVCIPLAALGLLSPTIAAAAMALSSVSVVGNSLWLRRWQPSLSRGT
ncbi:MAG: heavy metal translocating P-type ATPase [Gammaproteobacteria bacterium]|nr:heavy metal translocating P-type ATPase [Gammaproteobacteria bacterium]